MKKLNYLKNNINNKNITVLGAGISGQGASTLANYLGANVLLSNNKKIKNFNLLSNNIKIEFTHSKNCFNSDLVIISPGIDPNKSPIVKKLNTLKIPIISEIEFGFWFTKNPIIAVTGSNGKSTVVKILTKIFKKKYKNVMLGGNIGISFCMNIYKELNDHFDSSIHILELSSFQLQKIIQFKPKLSCILNVSNDHIDRHGNFKNYFYDKLKIIKNTDKNSLIVYNQDDCRLKKYFKKNKYAIPFSIESDTNDFIIKSSKIYCSKSNKLIINQNDTNLLGSHNLSNIIASIQISKLFGIQYKIIKKALLEFEPLEHRMEILKINSNITFVNDSKGTNLVSTESAINSFKENIILILGGYCKDTIDESIIKNLIDRNNIYKVICYGEIGGEISKIIKKVKNTTYIESFSSAVIFAIKSSIDNSIILLSPGFKSFDQFESFEERGNKFKEIVYKYYA